jgi:diguanylate cyclase (GGDEF)-like protein
MHLDPRRYRTPRGIPIEAAESVSSPWLRARTGVFLFAAGGMLSLLFIALPHSRDTNELVFISIAAIAYPVAILLLLVGERLPDWVFELLAFGGTVLVSLAIYFAGEARNDNMMVYLWPDLWACYFFTRRAAALQLAFIGSSYAAVLVLQGETYSALTRWIVTMVTLGVAGALVRVLRERLERVVARLADAARTDPLTGLLNRRGFEELVSLELERALRSDRPLGLLVGDLDHFKRVNDTLGHRAGDEALVRAAAVLAHAVRRIDVVARIGGEEFALLLPDSDAHGSYVLAERLREEIRSEFSADEVPLTISFGIVNYPDDGSRSDALMKAADDSLYAAKALGRDRSVIHSPELATIVDRDETI